MAVGTFTIFAAAVAAIGAGISASSSESSAERRAKLQREATAEELKKQRKQDQFQFGYTALAGQRRSAEETARRSIFNKQVFQALGSMRGSPAISTF